MCVRALCFVVLFLLTYKLLSPVLYMTLNALVITTRKKLCKRLKLSLDGWDLTGWWFHIKEWCQNWNNHFLSSLLKLNLLLYFFLTHPLCLSTYCLLFSLQSTTYHVFILSFLPHYFCRWLHAAQSGGCDRMQLCREGAGFWGFQSHTDRFYITEEWSRWWGPDRWGAKGSELRTLLLCLVFNWSQYGLESQRTSQDPRRHYR